MEELLTAALVRWGPDILIVGAIEEMSELQTELCHHLRGREANIAEEMADVILMVRQLENIFGNQTEVDRIVQQKTERLVQRLAAGESPCQL